MKQAIIKGFAVDFDLSAETRDAYKSWGDQITYLGEGKIIKNARGTEGLNKKLVHFWKIN